MAGAKAGSSGRSEWAASDERGSDWAIRFIVGCVRTLGTRPMVVLLAPITIYFLFFAKTARRASRDYLRRLYRFQGRPRKPTLLDSYRHIYSFATSILDRLAIWGDAVDDFQFQLHGREHMQPLIDAGQGAILLGAHIGNFDMLRVVAREYSIPVNVIMYQVNAEKINRAFAELDPDSNVRIINLDESSVNTGLSIRACVERGEFVAVLADRVRPGGRSRVMHASVLGASALLPVGPFRLGCLLGFPVVMVVALRSGPRRYDIHLDTISSGERVAPAERSKVVQEQVNRYAGLLERYCLEAPMQWFNFHEFWRGTDGD